MMATQGAKGRLVRLEQRLRPPGCDECRHWARCELVFLDKPLRPEVCPRCARRVRIESVVEFAIYWERL